MADYKTTANHWSFPLNWELAKQGSLLANTSVFLGSEVLPYAQLS